MVCREMVREACLISVCGIFYFLWFPELSTCSSKRKVTPVGVGRGEEFQATLKQSWILSMRSLKHVPEWVLLRY